jgi:REP element-mobilizing transposase RayT
MFRTRGYLPHISSPDGTFFVTYHLGDSLPAAVSKRLAEQYQRDLLKSHNDPKAVARARYAHQSKTEKFLDLSYGECWLNRPEVASMIRRSFLYFNEQRYHLHAWTIMPNHVHVLMDIKEALSGIMFSWKSYTSKQANKMLNRSGMFWRQEYFDRNVRSPRHFQYVVRYIANNPVKAGLCQSPFEWPWFGCSEEVGDLLRRFFL